MFQVEHILAQFILQSTKHLPDHRLFASSLAARLLEDNVDIVDIELIIASVDRAAISFDMGSISNLVNLVRSIIKPKAKSTGLLGTDLDKLCAKVVKAWLLTVPDDPDMEMGEVVVKMLESPVDDDVFIVHGLLSPVDEDHKKMRNMRNVKVALYNIMMDKHQTEVRIKYM